MQLLAAIERTVSSQAPGGLKDMVQVSKPNLDRLDDLANKVREEFSELDQVVGEPEEDSTLP